MSSITLTARLEREKVEAGKKHEMHLLVNLEGAKLPNQVRQSLDLGAVIDVSGSMAGQKIDYAKRTLAKLIDQMTERDTLGIAAFATEVFEVTKPEKMTPEAKERARTAVSQLRSLGSTNLSGALLKAYELTKGAGAEGIVRSLLFTDGQPTEGEQRHNVLIKMAEDHKPKNGGLSTFGFGDYDAELLDQMARKGGGNCHHIDSPEAIGPAFGKELGGLLTCVAQNVKITVTGKPGVRLIEVLNDLDVDAATDQSHATIQMDDVYSEEVRRLVLKIEVPAVEKGERPFKLGDIKVEYVDLVSKEQRDVEIPFKVQYVEKDLVQKDPDKEVLDHVACQEARKAQEEAMALASAGNYSGAQARVQVAMVMCSQLGTSLGHKMASDLGGHVMKRLSADRFHDGGEHYLHANARSYGAGRTMSAGTEDMFGTEAQLGMAKSFAGGDNDQGVAGSPVDAGQVSPVAPNRPTLYPPHLRAPAAAPANKPKPTPTLGKKRKHRS